MSGKRFLQYKPRKPTVHLKQTTVANAIGSKAASPTIMNGAKGTPTFPKGTFLQTVKHRSPYFLFGLVTISCLIGWPALFIEGSEIVLNVPPNSETALVQKTEEGYEVGDIKEVHRDIPDDDE
ncbi:uncharacterized protein CXQ87_002394 [Candidozyma duobushaemuli]|uniref:Uncharacterized protein n=1 Tax=Candidozyma duobushaemuli TaxID=1231522 RepID=A0A2V1A9K9_9ASCO|nr:uncharacterized protein CXQ87_002394 [[Candida] duobushaemulonis]PVH14266.1 hypothetical protein CXQ87_002394 [[Candida] duobushaemulonis]